MQKGQIRSLLHSYWIDSVWVHGHNTSVCHSGLMNFNEFLNECEPERVEKAGPLCTWHRVTDIDQQCHHRFADIFILCSRDKSYLLHLQPLGDHIIFHIKVQWGLM